MGGWRLRAASPADAGEVLVLSLAAFVSEAQRYGDPLLPPLRETFDDVRAAIADPAQRVVVAEAGAWTDWRPDRLLGAVRLRLSADGTGHVGRLVVAPDAQGRGLGGELLGAVDDAARAAGARRMERFTGAESVGSIRLYQRAGYAVTADECTDDRGVRLVVLTKPLVG